VPPAHGNGLGVRLLGGTNRAAIGRGDAVDAIVDTPLQPVDEGLHVVDDEPGVNLATNVGLAVAVGVLEVPDVRGGGDVDAAVPAGDAGRPRQSLGKNVAGLVKAVAVAVFEQPHAPQRGVAGFERVGVVAHFDDVKPTVFVVSRGHGTCNLWLVREQL